MSLPAADAPRRKQEIPAGLALSPGGRKLYVCGSLSNRLYELDAAQGTLLRSWDVGVAPFDVVLAGDKAYVSCWGGRRPQPGDLTGPAGRGTEVKVDPVRHIASEGSLSVIDLSGRAPVKHILAHLHASALALSPDGRYVVCANAGSDNLTVVATADDAVIETIWVKASPHDLFGAQPNALCFSSDGTRLYVANGTQNAIAVVDFRPGESRLRGLVPVGWFPGGVVYDRDRHQLAVANLKGLPSAPRPRGESQGYNTHQYTGSVTLLPVPSAEELPAFTTAVYRDLQVDRIRAAAQPPRPNQRPRPVPERIGEPSVFRHVVYVIKENRTYDQVLGDLPQGNGDPALCTFGAPVTPNQHKLATEFVLLDNTYCCGILSADGHQWSTSAIGTDYLERSFAGWPRSYPDGMALDDKDALAYAPSGFLWDNAIARGISLHNFGEFCEPACGWADPQRAGRPSWSDYYAEYLQPTGQVRIGSRASIASLEPYSPTDYVGWEMAVPDVWRAAYIIRQLAKWEQAGAMPQLILICLPDDHTSGASAGLPTPEAAMADNDLAFGRIVEAFSHSRFWPETVIFAIEDDPQAGWDHVSGYRTTAYCISPYTRRGETVSTLYNTNSLLRTMEQILGLPPMNQFDAAALPMYACFTDTPDLRPYDAVPNIVPLDQLNPQPASIREPLFRRDAIVSAQLDLQRPDRAPEDTLNQILWRATRGLHVPYPTWAITAVEDDDED